MTDDRQQLFLNDLAFARPGDKGNDADITVFARSPRAYEFLAEVLTAELVKSHFGHMVQGDVRRWEVPNVLALKFLLCDALAGGGPASLRADNLGKALGGAMLRLQLQAPIELHSRYSQDPDIHPPQDPYAEASWRV